MQQNRQFEILPVFCAEIYFVLFGKALSTVYIFRNMWYYRCSVGYDGERFHLNLFAPRGTCDVKTTGAFPLIVRGVLSGLLDILSVKGECKGVFKLMDKQRIENAVRELLCAVGEDPSREGLLETPRRVADMYAEIFGGMSEDPREHLKFFDESDNDELVVVRDIPLYSMCEHHLLPFIGRAHIAYIPSDGKVIGLSKLARITNCFSRRPQLQERLTAQIADFLYENLSPMGLAVVIEAEHLCMTMRGARASGAVTQTSALRGTMKSDFRTRSEVMSLLSGGRK